MLSSDVIAKVKQLELQTKRILAGSSAGDYTTYVRGSGFEFDQLRSYEYGDDVRYIDWNTSARMQNVYVRTYHEDRNRTVTVVLDATGSTLYGSHQQLKIDRMAEIAAVVVLAAHIHKDRIGLVRFGSQACNLPPRQGMPALMRIMEELFAHEKRGGADQFENAAYVLQSRFQQSSLMVIVTDGIDATLQKVRYLTKKHDILIVRVIDPLERVFAPSILLTYKDPESEAKTTADSFGQTRELKKTWLKWQQDQQNLLKSLNIDHIVIATDEPYINSLITFFKRRS